MQQLQEVSRPACLRSDLTDCDCLSWVSPTRDHTAPPPSVTLAAFVSRIKDPAGDISIFNERAGPVLVLDAPGASSEQRAPLKAAPAALLQRRRLPVFDLENKNL